MESTELLRRAASGDKEARDALYETCYAELRARAGQMMRHQGAHSLQPTILVHEAWLKLSLPDTDWDGRRHFLGVATRAMRCVLVDHARAKLTAKRGGGATREELVEDPATERQPEWRMLALDEALERLELQQPALYQVAQLRIFAGLPHREIAALLGLTERTIERHWAAARDELREAL